MSKIKKQDKKTTTQKVIVEPIGSRIAKAVYEAKKISERIFGYISYDINFIRATYTGKTQRPAKITAIEKGIVGIMLVDETSSFVKIGTILGLDVVNDKAEQSLLRTAIESLKSFNAIEGDDSCMALTDSGRAYADKGERPDTYTKSFDIFVDLAHPSWLDIKNGIGDNSKQVSEINTPCEDINLSIDQIKSYAEKQAQDVHYPQSRFLLQSAHWTDGHASSYKIYVCFVQNVANSEDVRAFVYDENLKGLNNILAEHINNDEVLKSELLNNCIRLECENDADTVVLEGEELEIAKLEIPVELKQAEQKMIDEEAGNELPIEDYDEGSDSKPDKDIALSKVPARNRLHKKALYDSLSFEIELQKIFTEDEPDEVWLISPWIRKGAFIHDRGPMIENFLKNESKKVFIAYSEPASNNDGKPMMDEEVEPSIKLLESQYSNFYYVQLPEFHLKNVIEVKDNQKILFSGSFNVLSFSVSEQQTHIRREEMALAHHTVAKKKYMDCLLEFAQIYSERILKEIESLDPSKIENYKNERLDYFLSIKDSDVHELFSPIEDLLEEKAITLKKEIIHKELTSIGQKLIVASNMGGLNAKDKKQIEDSLTMAKKSLDENAIDDPSMLELYDDNKSLLSAIPLKKIFPDKIQKRDFTKSFQKPIRKKEEKVNDIEQIPVSQLSAIVSEIINASDKGRRHSSEDLTKAKQLCSPLNMDLSTTDKLFKVLAGANLLATAIKFNFERKMTLNDVHNSLRCIIKKSNEIPSLSIIYNAHQERIIFDVCDVQFQFEKFSVNEELKSVIDRHHNEVNKWNGSKTFMFSCELVDVALKYNILD